MTTVEAPDVPVLTADDLRDIAARARPPEKRAERPKRLAVFGRAVPGLVTAETEEGPFEVVEVRSEIELRERLLADRRDAKRDGRIFLLAWPYAPATLPLDLRHGFAVQGILRRVGVDRLRRRLGGRPVSAEVAASELALLLDALPDDRIPPYAAPSIDMAGAWRIYLAAQARLPILERPDGAALQLFVLAARGGVGFAADMRGRRKLIEKLDAFLVTEYGPLAPVAWRAFEAERGRAFVAAGLVADALVGSREGRGLARPLTPEERGAADLRLTQIAAEHGVPGDLLALWGRDAAEAVRDLAAPGRGKRARALARDLPDLDASIVAPLLKEADLATQHLGERLVHGSVLLPRARTSRLAALAEQAREVAGMQRPPAEALEETQRRLAAVEAHERGRPEEIEAAWALARLVAYLVCARRGALAAPRADATDASLAEVAGWHVRHGGFIDRAVRELAQLHVPELAAGTAAVTAAIREKRARANRVFAARLKAWHAAGAPAQPGVVPIQDVLAAKVAPFLAADPGRTVLVALMDGLSVDVASELFESMKEAGFGLVAASGAAADALWPDPVLAALPSVTNVTRAAFFAGRVPEPAADLPPTDVDSRRFASHSVLARHEPLLFMKREVGTGSGLAPVVADTIRDRSKRVVGVVVNAVDDWLSGPQQLVPEFGVESLKPLRALLDLCAEVGRTVLVVSDHGHTFTDGSRIAGAGPTEHARWRVARGPSDATADEFVFAGPRVWCPTGAPGVALPAISGATYVPRRVGAHGGATLEEVVVTAAFFEPGGAPYPIPHWWRLEPSATVQGATPGTAGAAGRGTVPVHDPSLPLFPASVARDSLSARLLESPVWKEVRRRLMPPRFSEDKLYALLEAMERRPRISAVEFTEIVGEPERRIPGFIAQAGRLLNVGGAEILAYDRDEKRVTLDIDLLVQVFEVARGS